MKPEHKALLQNFTASHNGKPLDQKALLRANPLIAKTLAARFASMTTEQQKSMKGILTPETLEPLKVLLPELNDILDRGIKFVKRGMRNG
jgi:hypothetical protein